MTYVCYNNISIIIMYNVIILSRNSWNGRVKLTSTKLVPEPQHHMLKSIRLNLLKYIFFKREVGNQFGYSRYISE